MERIKVLQTDEDSNTKELWTFLKNVGTLDINHDRLA